VSKTTSAAPGVKSGVNNTPTNSSERASSLSKGRPTTSQFYGEVDQFAEVDKDKLKIALQREEENKRSAGDGKRKYNSVHADVDVTAEDMEAYRMKKGRGDDPLAKLADSEEILEYKK
jgi:pre-mRNA-processing factor SLU7